MLVKGDVKCLHCGHVSGEWMGERGTPLTSDGARFDVSSADAGAPLRCRRCRGPVYLDSVEPVATSARLRRIQRLRAQLAAAQTTRPDRAARRGRAA
jgi:hypothetical protein